MELKSFWWFTEDDGEICLGSEPSTLANTVISTGWNVREGFSFRRQITKDELVTISQEMLALDAEGGGDGISCDNSLATATGLVALAVFEEFLNDYSLGFLKRALEASEEEE